MTNKYLSLATLNTWLGVELHSTRGLGPAVQRWRAAGLRATWALHSRCNQLGVSDFSTRCRLYRILTQPVPNYCSEVWSPHAMSDLHSALHARLQVLENDYLRQLGGLRGRVPALVLARESCLQPLAFMWLQSCTKYWNRFISCGDGLLRRAFVGDLHLAASLSLDLESPGGRRCRACRTWSGAWLRVLHWLSLAGGANGQRGRSGNRRLSDAPVPCSTWMAPNPSWGPILMMGVMLRSVLR